MKSRGVPQFTNKLSQQLAKFKDSSTISIAHQQIRKLFGQYNFNQIANQFASKMDSCDRLSQRQKKQYSKIYISLIDAYGAQVLYQQYYQRIMQSLSKKSFGVAQVIGHLCKNLLSRIDPPQNIIDYISYILGLFKHHSDISRIIRNIVQSSIDVQILINFESQMMTLICQKILHSNKKIQPIQTLLSMILTLEQHLVLEYIQNIIGIVQKYYKNEDYNVRKTLVDICYAIMVVQQRQNQILHRIVKELKYDKIKHVRQAVMNYQSLYKQLNKLNQEQQQKQKNLQMQNYQQDDQVQNQQQNKYKDKYKDKDKDKDKEQYQQQQQYSNQKEKEKEKERMIKEDIKRKYQEKYLTLNPTKKHQNFIENQIISSNNPYQHQHPSLQQLSMKQINTQGQTINKNKSEKLVHQNSFNNNNNKSFAHINKTSLNNQKQKKSVKGARNNRTQINQAFFKNAKNSNVIKVPPNISQEQQKMIGDNNNINNSNNNMNMSSINKSSIELNRKKRQFEYLPKQQLGCQKQFKKQDIKGIQNQSQNRQISQDLKSFNINNQVKFPKDFDQYLKKRQINNINPIQNQNQIQNQNNKILNRNEKQQKGLFLKKAKKVKMAQQQQQQQKQIQRQKQKQQQHQQNQQQSLKNINIVELILNLKTTICEKLQNIQQKVSNIDFRVFKIENYLKRSSMYIDYSDQKVMIKDYHNNNYNYEFDSLPKVSMTMPIKNEKQRNKFDKFDKIYLNNKNNNNSIRQLQIQGLSSIAQSQIRKLQINQQLDSSPSSKKDFKNNNIKQYYNKTKPFTLGLKQQKYNLQAYELQLEESEEDRNQPFSQQYQYQQPTIVQKLNQINLNNFNKN